MYIFSDFYASLVIEFLQMPKNDLLGGPTHPQQIC